MTLARIRTFRRIGPQRHDAMTDSATQDQATEAQVAAAIARCAAGDRARAARHLRHRGRRAWSAWRGACCGARTSPKRRCRTPSCGSGGRRGTFDPQKGAARSWLYAILRNCALTILRDEGRFIADEDVAEEAAPMTESALARLPETSALRRCLERLDAQRRAVVVLAYVHGLSHGELAGKLGVPLGTVKSWVRRSLISLQECMG